MKETAIEWLLEELNSGRHLTDKLIEQAKRLENKQKIEMFDKGFNEAEHYFDEDLKKIANEINRVEIIQHSPPYNGRAYTNRDAKNVEIHLQDGGKTLKIFLI